MSIVKASPPNLIGQASPEFRKDDFESAIWNKGYDVYLERAVECPCRTEKGEAFSSCQNCLGVGWIFINTRETKAIIVSLNKTTQYKDWSEELIGTVSITVREESKFGFMDRITIKNSPTVSNTSYFSQIVNIRDRTGSPFVFLAYKPINIDRIYAFNGVSSALIKIPNTDYSINVDNPYVIDFTYDFTQISGYNGSISILYEHELQYHVLDIPHDTRNSYIKDSNGKDQQITMPINAIARKAHNVIGIANRDGSGTIDNSD